MSEFPDLLRAMLAFGALLRDTHVPVTTPALVDGVRALESIDLSDRQQVRLALGAILVSRREEQVRFDHCFDAFWTFPRNLASMVRWRSDAGEGLPQDDRCDAEPDSGSTSHRHSQAEAQASDDDAAGDSEPCQVPAESDLEALIEQDFSTFGSEQLEEVARLTQLIAKRLARRVSRRRKPSRRTGVVDLRRTMRASVMRGEVIELQRRARRRRKLRLVLLCDVSGSMNVYSRFLLQFLYSLQNVFGQVHTFTFATSLTCVSDLLRSPNYKAALARLSAVRDWSGGTRIGDSLTEFNRTWGTLVDRRSVVVLLSDGWDAGEPDTLEREMLTIKRRAGKVIWLNPLLGDPSYEPLTRGMVAALPLVDRFAAAHNLASLRELAGHLTLR